MGCGGIDCSRLDDFTGGDWVGINYQEPDKPFYDFPAIISEVSNRNKDSKNDYVLVKMAPIECPARLQREYVSKIWHLGEASSHNGH